MQSLMSLCLNVGIPPEGQVKACSTVRFSPTHMLLAYLPDATHTAEQQHPGRVPCAGRSQTHLLAKHLANWRHPSPLQDPLLASWCLGSGLGWFLTFICMLPFLCNLLFIRRFLLKHILHSLCVGTVLVTHVSKYSLSTQ